MTNPQEQFCDFYRTGLKATADAIRISLENAERLRKQQLAAIDETLSSHAVAVGEIDKAKGFDQLIAIQARLAGAQYQAIIDYWSGIFQASGEGQVELTRRAQAQAKHLRENLQATIGSDPGTVVPMIAVLQPLMEVASSAYALTSRATEEAAKLTAAQLAGANAGGRQSAKQAARTAA